MQSDSPLTEEIKRMFKNYVPFVKETKVTLNEPKFFMDKNPKRAYTLKVIETESPYTDFILLFAIGAYLFILGQVVAYF